MTVHHDKLAYGRLAACREELSGERIEEMLGALSGEERFDRRVLFRAADAVISWYRKTGRKLPWRENADPYRVWVSEIMLQQTRIEAVIPHYVRFMRELPDVYALAAVPADKLMKLWEGLGYYSRARNLKRAAETVVTEFGGVIPADYEKLRKLAGIGAYTAGAIASVAFGLPCPAVDGNVLRVLARLFADGADVLDPGTRKAAENALRGIYPQGEDASALTQGLMELGEVVCLPGGAPLCASCPLCALCAAHAQGREEDYPVRTARKERKKQPRTVFLLRCGDSYALQKRQNKGLLAAMWEFPGCDGHLGVGEAAEMLAFWGAEAQDVQPCGGSVHLFTHIEWDMQWFYAVCSARADGFVWATAEEIARQYAIPSAFRHYKTLIKNDKNK